MTGLLGGFERVARGAVWVSGLALIALAVLVSVDVICRKWLGVTLAGSDEISGYVLACAAAWGYSFCLLRRGHIRIDVIYNLVGPRAQRILDLLGLLALLVFMALLTHRAVGVLAKTLDSGAVSNTPLLTPLWIPQSLWVAGLIFFTATLALVTARTILLLVRRDYAGVGALAGIPSVAEEIAAEVPAGMRACRDGEEGPACRR
jgi:TRAP-type C4-dicarboxylate transport system permease small subunit